MDLEARDAKPFQSDKLSRNYWKVCRKFLKIYTQIYQKKILNFNFCHAAIAFHFFLLQAKKPLSGQSVFPSFFLPFTGLLLTKIILLEWCFSFFLSAFCNLSTQCLTLKFNLVQSPQNLTRAPADLSLFKGPGNPNCLLQPPGCALLAAMVAHNEAEGNPLPPSQQSPCKSFQAKLNCPPCLFQDVHFAHKFDSSEWPLAHYSACRGCCIIAHRACP